MYLKCIHGISIFETATIAILHVHTQHQQLRSFFNVKLILTKNTIKYYLNYNNFIKIKLNRFINKYFNF